MRSNFPHARSSFLTLLHKNKLHRKRRHRPPLPVLPPRCLLGWLLFIFLLLLVPVGVLRLRLLWPTPAASSSATPSYARQLAQWRRLRFKGPADALDWRPPVEADEVRVVLQAEAVRRDDDAQAQAAAVCPPALAQQLLLLPAVVNSSSFLGDAEDWTPRRLRLDRWLLGEIQQSQVGVIPVTLLLLYACIFI